MQTRQSAIFALTFSCRLCVYTTASRMPLLVPVHSLCVPVHCFTPAGALSHRAPHFAFLVAASAAGMAAGVAAADPPNCCLDFTHLSTQV